MDNVREKLAALSGLVLRQQERIAALEGKVSAAVRAVNPPDDGASTRRQLLLAAAAAVGGAAAVGASSTPAAAVGTPVYINTNTNIGSAPTGIAYTGTIGQNYYGFAVTDHGLSHFNDTATIAGHTQGGFSNAVLGYDTSNSLATTGVFGLTTRGIGVKGHASSEDGIAIEANGGLMALFAAAHGSAQAAVLGTSAGDAAAGVHGSANRFGVRGKANLGSPNSIGVFADGGLDQSTALAVNGVMRVTRAGRLKIPAGARTMTVAVSPLTATTLVFATLQAYVGTLAVSGVSVRTAAPTSLTIALTGNAPAAGVFVVWVAIDMMGTVLASVPDADAAFAARRNLDAERAP